ncbi:aldehyde ferredoxin oxidoreductase N-terminal domain-containing protein [Chloroflexota bacterium]
METAGYSGRILKLNLTTGKSKIKILDYEIARKFIGDFGINARLAYDLMESGTDPLSPGNVILIGAGPFVGTRLQAPRCTVLTKMPLTNAIAFASGGMDFSREQHEFAMTYVLPAFGTVANSKDFVAALS